MGAATSTTASSPGEGQWMWQSNSNPWSTTQTPEWSCYSEVNNTIIEEAYRTKKKQAILDNYYLDFSQMVQIANNDNNKRRPIKRVIKNSDSRDDVQNGKAFSASAPAFAPVKASVFNRPGAFGDFIWEAYLLGQWRNVPQEIRVERAAQGIIEEGKKIGKQMEGEKIAQHLLEVKYGTRKEIWRRCAYLYSLESFLYKELNETLRLVNLEEHKQEWRSKLETLGLFAWFLFDFPQDADEFEGHVYRGVELKEEDISSYKDAAETGELLAFPDFAATSVNRSKAEPFGNTVFIISVNRSRETSFGVADLSEYPDEEERLLIPGFLFKVIRVEFNAATKKHLIYLQDCNNQ
jgi:hypothetical protein